jgi:NADPH-dependent curcumin reductase CurA
MPTTSREVHLQKRPQGLPTPAAFTIATVEVPDPKPGEVLVRNLYMSVDPYMRGRMVDRKSYTPPFPLHEALTGGAVGQVVQSDHPDFAEGAHVLHGLGWREYFISGGNGLHKIDPLQAPAQRYLGVMGMPGQTAYFGLLDIGAPKAGETVFVSAAAGAVGSIVCQIAKLQGCRVVGSAGSPEKIAWLEKVGVDAVLNYKETDNLTRTLGKLCPDGIDVYFENVGGDHLQAALTHMNNHGRIVACGMISQYKNSDTNWYSISL